MKKRILRYFKHLLLTIIMLLVVGLIIIVFLQGSIDYGHDPEKVNLNKEGPHVFYETDSILNINYIKGNKTEGFTVDKKIFNLGEKPSAHCFFPLDKSTFEFTINTEIEIPPSVYNDGQPILALSDIESGYRTFRDFLINNKVIDAQLNWTFDKGHLVLVGDFMDRGYSTTQVLWFIYKLEQEATKFGGKVHFILGNHELYNLQGKYESASPKYYGVASILGKQHHDLFGTNSLLGKWISSKNTIELINGVLFTHGGIHSDITKYQATLPEINQINRANYPKPYFPKPEENLEQLLRSSKTGICWYRGYFKGDLKQEEVEKGINMFDAKAVVVGHTIQRHVSRHYNGKVIGIDVKHPKDYNQNWPNKKSEGLLIANDTYFRLLENGNRKEL